MFKVKSLQTKLKLIVAGILVLAGLMLTAGLVYNADNRFVEIQDIIIGTTEAEGGVRSTGIAQALEGTASEAGDYLAEPVEDEPVYASQIVPIRKQFAYSSILYLLGIILIGIIIAFVAIDNAFRPMKKLNSTIQHMDAHHLSVRVEEGKGEDEVSQLAKAFNHMLERLEKVFEMQKNFASSAAHELKTPIAVMKASIQVLELDETPVVEDYRENMEIMKQEIEKLRLIVEDLFQLNSGQQITFKESISLNELLHEIKLELEQSGKMKEVKVEVKVADAYLYGSRNLIYRVFLNLIENAIKYNKPKGTVSVYTTLEEKLKIHVQDTGMGIAKEALTHIYEPFYRENDKKNGQSGAGLGLSIVKNIIDQHEWGIEVHSEEEMGTEFIINVPGEDYEIHAKSI